jgi:hypothetical protein
MSVINEAKIYVRKDDDPFFIDKDIEQAYFQRGYFVVSRTLWNRIEPMLKQLKEGERDGRFQAT